MKRKIGDLTKEEMVRTLDMLYTAASSVKGRDATKLFLRDLLTPSERVMLGRRIWIARLILQGVGSTEIERKLRVGQNTVTRVERWLNDQFPGYENALAELEKEMDRRAIRREASQDPFSFAALKCKYPLHFLLFSNPKPKKHYRD